MSGFHFSSFLNGVSATLVIISFFFLYDAYRYRERRKKLEREEDVHRANRRMLMDDLKSMPRGPFA